MINLIFATVEHPDPVPGSDVIPVPHKRKVGRVVDAFMRADGQLLNTVEVWHDNDAFIEEFMQDYEQGRCRWGGSWGKDLKIDTDRFDIQAKDISHLALTRYPAHGDDKEQGATWVHFFSRDPALFYGALQKLMVEEEQRVPGVGLFMDEETRERLQPLFTKSEQQALERQEQQQQEMMEVIQTQTQSDARKPLSLDEAVLADPDGSHSTHSTAPDSLDSSMAAATDPMQGVTPTQPTPIAQPPQVADGEQERKSRYDKFITRFKPWNEKTFAKPDEPTMDPETFTTAAQLSAAWQETTKDDKIKEVPREMMEAGRLVDDYLSAIGQFVASKKKETYEADTSLRDSELNALSNPLSNLPYAVSVLSNTLRADYNADKHAVVLKAQREAAEAAAKAKEAELLKQIETLRTEKEAAEKRARTETIAAALNAPVRPIQGSTLPGAGAAGLPLHMAVPDAVVNLQQQQQQAQQTQQQPQTVSVISSRTYNEDRDPKFNRVTSNWSVPKYLSDAKNAESRNLNFSSDRPRPFTRFADLHKSSQALGNKE